MNKSMLMGLGVVLIIIALILGVVRYFEYYDFGVTYGSGMGWYFYGFAGIIGLIGIILLAWSMYKKTGSETPPSKPA